VSTAVLVLLGSAWLVGFAAFAWTSHREGEQRASRIAFGIAAIVSLLFFLATLLPPQVEWFVLGAVAAGTAAALVGFLLPIGRVERGEDVPRVRVDERDIMFARARLEPGSADYEAYYAMRPEHKAGDDMTRRLPGLLASKGSAFHPLVFGVTDASFELTEALRDAVDGPVAPAPARLESQSITTYLKHLTRYHGAHSVGVTELEPYHVYTHIGRGSGQYGAPVRLSHRYALAFTVEMDHRLVGTAPYAPTVMESARQYVEAAKIAIQVASFIRGLGYPARAHIDGNYRVIAPLVARDAGLGGIGRMGLLMTPSLGPRVRLGVVTTDLPLARDQRIEDAAILDFCQVCKKCAECCPIHAIPEDDRQENDGALRWRIDPDLCFRYWHAVGTDCARCMAVCPYSHPDTAMHNVVRWAVRRSGAARRAAVWLDDLFYGSLPGSRPFPPWVPPTLPRGSNEHAS
jgi:ferredoxin